MRLNISGLNIRHYRIMRSLSQKELSDLLKERGRNIWEEDIRLIEEGKGCVFDIDIPILADILHVKMEDLLIWSIS